MAVIGQRTKVAPALPSELEQLLFPLDGAEVLSSERREANEGPLKGLRRQEPSGHIHPFSRRND